MKRGEFTKFYFDNKDKNGFVRLSDLADNFGLSSFDPYDEEDIYEGICRLVDDPVEAVASGNTWEDSSRRIKKVYRDAASEMC